MKLLVDGVFFQLARTGIARVWSSILPRLANYPDLNIAMLDRGMSPSVEGIKIVEFPSYTFSNAAADSLLIDRHCRELGIDVFASTYYTTPVSVPSVLVVYDMIPEIFGFDMSARAWQEKEIAISFASYFACISGNTRADLKRFYPAISDDRAIVTYCGVDHNVFRPRDRIQVGDFRKRLNLVNPYYVLVGSREQHRGYKNADLLFSAIREFREDAVEILCIGGEPEVDSAHLAGLPKSICARRVELNDQDLACAYSSAEALVYPSLYEGFGMPVIEAMACGCPVITTRYGSLGEVSGNAAVFISGHDAHELLDAIMLVRDANKRGKLIEAGLQQAARYGWDDMARGIHDLLKRVCEERNDPAMQEFLVEWKRLRKIQAEVDVGT